VNQGEIDAAKLALTTSKSTKVRDFAQMMIDDHQKSIADAKQVFSEANVTATPSELSRKLTAQNDEMVKKMKGLSGAAFDKQYMSMMISGHQQVLDLIDRQLAPAANKPELKTLLTGMRTLVSAHLAAAQTLQPKT